MRELPCPGCGTTLEVDSRFALFLVCESCDSTVVVDEAAARVHGKMGALAPPEGLFYLGAAGDLGGVRFQVMGRVRYGYGRGYWNEWLLGLEDGRACWVSEDEDELKLEVLGDGTQVAFDYEVTSPGTKVQVGSSEYHVDEKDVAVCEGGEGQLPFPIVFGEKIPYLELSGPERFATIEFGEGGPRVFLGRPLERSEVTLDTSRADAGVGDDVVTQSVAGASERVVLGQGATKKLNCDQCGAPLEVSGDAAGDHECEYCGHVLDLSVERKPCASCQKTLPVRHAGTKAATCPHCGTLNDVGGEKTQILIALTGRNRPSVPLRPGMKGRLLGEDHEVIGHMRLVERDSWGTYTGNEFLLRRADGETVWLVLEDGHWSYKTEIQGDRPDVDPRRLEEEQTFSWAGQTWEVDDKSEGSSETIDWVEGEFTWVPKVGDTSAYMEAESPPFSVIAEWSATEMEWYRAQYLEPKVITEAFGLKPDAVSRPAARAKAGAPPAVAPPHKRWQLRGTLGLGILSLVIGAVAQGAPRFVVSDSYPMGELNPPASQAVAERLDAAEARWQALRKVVTKAEVEVGQAQKLETMARRKEAAKSSNVAHYRRHAGLAWSAATRAVSKAVRAAGGTPPTTWTPGPDGFPAYPMPSLKQKVSNSKAAITQLMEGLEPVPEPLPESWPSQVLSFEVGEGEKQGLLEVLAPLRGDWVHVQVRVTRDGDGAELPVAEFSETLLSSGWASTVRETLAFDLPKSGLCRVSVRAVTGRRGWERVAPPRSPGKLAVTVRQGKPAGTGAAGGALFFFTWFGFELCLRIMQYVWYLFRLTFSALGGLFS